MATKWNDASLYSPVAYAGSKAKHAQVVAEALAKGQKSEGMSLILFESKATTAKNANGMSTIKETPQNRACQAIRSTMFGAERNDYRFGVAARLFKCMAVNISNVTKEQDKVFNAENTPILLFVNRGGQVVQALYGVEECDSEAVFGAMCAALEKEGTKQAKQTIAKACKLLQDLLAAETQIEMAKSGQKRKQDSAAERLEEGQKKKADVLKKEEDLMKEMGGSADKATAPAEKGQASATGRAAKKDGQALACP